MKSKDKECGTLRRTRQSVLKTQENSLKMDFAQISIIEKFAEFPKVQKYLDLFAKLSNVKSEFFNFAEYIFCDLESGDKEKIIYDYYMNLAGRDIESVQSRIEKRIGEEITEILLFNC